MLTGRLGVLNPGRREDRFGGERQRVRVLDALIIRRIRIKGNSGNVLRRKAGVKIQKCKSPVSRKCWTTEVVELPGEEK